MAKTLDTKLTLVAATMKPPTVVQLFQCEISLTNFGDVFIA